MLPDDGRARDWARTQVKPKRWDHVCGVVATAERLARRDAPEAVAVVRLAAWFHDVARHWNDDALLSFAEAHHLPITPLERRTPMLLHGLVGYTLATQHFGFEDAAVRSACTYHTVGHPAMSVPDKIVFLADFIEPGRRYAGVQDLRDEAERGLDRGVLRAIDQTVLRLIDKGTMLDTRQIELRNVLLAAGVHYR